MSSESNYVAPAKGSNFFNDTVARLAKMGISVYGSRLLYVKGRKTGQLRSTAVNPLTVDGQRYLVAPRGTTQWVRNLRAANGEGELRLGRKTERFTATEMEDGDKPEILRPYLKRYAFEVGMFFDDVSAKSPESELQRIAPRHPVFRITAR
ncbi:MAG TPA: nitroreductase family deazaflavin-dependent oxidoreductase [Trebonia sp.]|jgi:deazaflavin-dependent oxidoreductase (nitroreductase family)|nr:nitroreductase family deazaflavin-dependent oxidoreductase [Trebonia sp.]